MALEKFRRVLRSYLFSVATWSSLSLLTAWQYRVFNQAMNIRASFSDMLRLAEARGFAFAILTPPIFYLVRKNVGKKHRGRHLLTYGLGVVPFMLLYAGIRWIILPPWDGLRQAFVPRSERGLFGLIEGGFADQITIYIAIVAAAHAYVYFARMRKQELERSDDRQALATGELQALKMQIHPHFLFNTLHGISTLIDGDQRTAKSMIVKLSSLLRTALEHGSSDLIPLDEELKFVGKYLDLEKMRLGSRLSISWSIDPETQPVLVPQLILQPLAENAIRHGIACSREGGWVEILTLRKNGTVELQVRNSIGGKSAVGTGVGLRNIEARLRYLYSDEAALFFSRDARTATAKIVMPALGAQPLGAEQSSWFQGDRVPESDLTPSVTK